jgi:hypothetical protein
MDPNRINRRGQQMRVKLIAGLAIAGAATAAVAVAGAAYASGEDGGSDQVRIVYEDQGTAGSTSTAVDGRDCPEGSRGGQGSSPGSESPGSEEPSTPSQPGTEQPSESSTL